MLESNGVSTGEFKVFRVIPQQNHEIQTDVSHASHGNMDRSQISLPFQSDDNQSGTILASTPLKLTAGHDPPHQGERKSFCLSGPLFVENTKPTFHISQLDERSLSQPHGGLSINEKLQVLEICVLGAIRKGSSSVSFNDNSQGCF
ncbi:unnamed protein product [Linum trigynum]|uniref:Uncharacterized protein n=1 Tax=Linum trigynum TaxID=586398 RepID=A0AAV2CIC5_9ROSI